MPHKDRSGHSFLEICIYSSSFRSVPSTCDPYLSTDGRCPFVSLVALLAWRDLLLCAKHLFVAAKPARCRPRNAGRACGQAVQPTGFPDEGAISRPGRGISALAVVNRGHLLDEAAE